MKRIHKRFLIFGSIALVGIQFIPADANKQVVIPDSDFRHEYDVPNNVMNILESFCYDCHSNNTNYPWYSHIQPIRLMMDHHIEEGKEELNFSELGNYSKRRQKNKLKAIINQIKDDEMPLSSYTLIHSNAKLSEGEKKEIVKWFKTKLKD